jgi:hypothetical protein
LEFNDRQHPVRGKIYRKRPTPVTNDEVKRRTRLHRPAGFEYLKLDERQDLGRLRKE